MWGEVVAVVGGSPNVTGGDTLELIYSALKGISISRPPVATRQ